MKTLIALLLFVYSVTADAVTRAPRPLVSITYTGGYSSYAGIGPLDVLHTYGRLYGFVGDNVYALYIQNLTTPRIISADIKLRVNEVTPSDGISTKFVYYDAPQFVTSGCGVVVDTRGTCTMSVIYTPTETTEPYVLRGYVFRVFFNTPPEGMTNEAMPYRIYPLDTYVQ